MKRHLPVVMISVAMLFPATQAQADPCGGASPFIDVPQNAGFCADAAWAKNALITTGCGNGTTFCPFEDVTRAQMVLFLRRMAVATFPGQAFAESSAPPSGDLDSGVNACATGSIAVPAGGNVRFAHVHAAVSLRAAASADVQLSIGYSRDGGAFNPHNMANQIVTVPAGQWANASVIGVLIPQLFPGTSNQWRVDLSRAPGSASTGELTDLRCQIKVLTHMAPVPPF